MQYLCVSDTHTAYGIVYKSHRLLFVLNDEPAKTGVYSNSVIMNSITQELKVVYGGDLVC